MRFIKKEFLVPALGGHSRWPIPQVKSREGRATSLPGGARSLSLSDRASQGIGSTAALRIHRPLNQGIWSCSCTAALGRSNTGSAETKGTQ